jgi:GNAT superfamily N-acetyltransferase
VSERLSKGIARARPEDAEQVASFRIQGFGPDSHQADARRNTWLYQDNPFLDSAGPGIWICRRDETIVGYQSEIPFELQVGRDRRRAAWAIDLLVQSEWRLRGVGTGLIATQLREHSIVGVLNVSEDACAAYQHLGWPDLGVVPVYVRPLDGRGVLGVLQVPVPKRLGSVTTPLAGPGLRGVDATVSAGLRATGTRLVVTDRLDERVDEVWENAASHYAVLARRDIHSLAWVIDARPDHRTLTRYYLVRRGQTLGYAVVRPGTVDRLPVAVVVDYLAPPRWVAPLLLAAGRRARRNGAAALLVRTRNEPADRRLRAAGFVRRESIGDPSVRLMVHCEDEPGICALVNDPDSWFVTSADCDLDHTVLAPQHRRDAPL